MFKIKINRFLTKKAVTKKKLLTFDISTVFYYILVVARNLMNPTWHQTHAAINIDSLCYFPFLYSWILLLFIVWFNRTSNIEYYRKKNIEFNSELFFFNWEFETKNQIRCYRSARIIIRCCMLHWLLIENSENNI